MHKSSTAAAKSSGVLHRQRDPQARVPPASSRTIQYVCGGRPASGYPSRVAQRTQAGAPLRHENQCIIRASLTSRKIEKNQPSRKELSFGPFGQLRSPCAGVLSYRPLLKQRCCWHLTPGDNSHNFPSPAQVHSCLVMAVPLGPVGCRFRRPSGPPSLTHFSSGPGAQGNFSHEGK